MRQIFTDLYCENCDYIEQDVFIPENYNENKKICPKCGNKLNQYIGFGSFKLTFNQKTDLCDWNGNHNCYWDAVKKARNEGRKVKACNEN